MYKSSKKGIVSNYSRPNSFGCSIVQISLISYKRRSIVIIGRSIEKFVIIFFKQK